MELQAFVNHLPLQFRDPVFGHAGGRHVKFALQVLGDAVIDENLRCGRAGLEVRHDELRVLKIPDGLAKSLAVLDEVQGRLQRLFDAGHGTHRDDKAFLRKLAHQLVEAFALFPAQHIFRRYEYIVEKQFRRVGRVEPYLVELLAALESFCAFGLEQHQRNALGPFIGIGLGDDDDEVRGLAVGDVGFRAVDAIAVPILQRSRGDALQIGPNAGLGHGNRADQFAAYQLWQILLFLLFGAMAHEIGQDHGVVQRCGKALHSVLRLLVDYDHFVPEVAAMAAVFLGHRHTQQSRLPRFVPESAFDLPVLAPFEDTLFRRMLLIELADRVGEDRDFLVLHEFGLGYIDCGHMSGPLRILLWRAEGSYLPFQLGARFSAKAAAPSRASSDTNTGAISWVWRV